MARTPRKTRTTRAPRTFSLTFGGINDALVVRVHSASRQRVYVIPLASLQLYELKNMSGVDQAMLDAFFNSHNLPKVDAAIVATLHIMDGSS